MTPTQPIAPDYAAAWDRLSDVVASEMGPVPDLALIEPGIRILELSAAYREAHAAHAAALTAALQGQCRPLVSAAAWGRLEDERRAAESVMEAAKSALLSAALDIT